MIRPSFVAVNHSLKLGLVIFSIPFSISAKAATFYASSSGNDSNSGLSEGAPVKTVATIASKLGNGDVLLLKRGEVFKELNTVVINAANVTIGAYGAGERPIIHGQGRTEPGGIYTPQVNIYGNGVRFSDISLYESSGQGLVVTGDNVKVEGVYVHEPYHSGITIYNSSDSSEVINSEVNRHNWGKEYGGLEGGWGVAFSAKGTNFVLRNNYAHDGWGEGLNANCGATNGVIEHNVSIGNRVGIYVDAGRNIIVRNNLVHGSNISEFMYGSGRPGNGIVLNTEDNCYAKSDDTLGDNFYTDNVQVYNNLVAFSLTGFSAWMELPEQKYSNVKVYNNTFVNNLSQLQLSGGGRGYSGTIIANNIFHSDVAGQKLINGFNGTPIGATFSNNYWSSLPEYSWAKGGGDVIGGLTMSKTGGWTSVSSRSQLSATDFTPTLGSSTISAGSTQLPGITLTEDYFKAKVDATRIDIGAIQSKGVSIQPPAAPSDFLVE